MIDRIFILYTHRTPTRTTQTFLFSVTSIEILPLVVTQAKKQAFEGALDVQLDLAGNLSPFKPSKSATQKL